MTDRLFSPILFLVLDTMLLSCAEGSRPCGSGDTASFGACGDVLKVTGQGAFGQFPRDSYANTHLRLWHTWQRGLGDTRHNPDLSSEGFVIPATGEAETGIDVDSESFTVLTASVGTGDPRCLPYYMKLCRKDVEARIASSTQALRPDVVAIQETLPHWLCAR